VWVVDVQRAGPANWETVKLTRLRALADSPRSFGSTLAREVRFDDEEWQRRVAAGNWFLAWSRGCPVGLVAAIAEDGRPDERHLVAMWVEPERRGSGAAAALMKTVCEWARVDGAASVTLWVADGNLRARRFYERLGFCSTGERQPLPSAPEISEERMHRPLAPMTGRSGSDPR
jgi:GNAT superfamily N-acetyltransferase